MKTGITGPTRRRLLRVTAGTALSVTALAGCGLFDDDAEPAASDVLQPVLDEAAALAAAYDRAAAAQPGLAARLTPLAADHRLHITELAKVIGTFPPTGTPSAVANAATGDEAGTTAALRTAEQAAQKTAAAACKAAPAVRAALVGSIAACRAAHAEALR